MNCSEQLEEVIDCIGRVVETRSFDEYPPWNELERAVAAYANCLGKNLSEKETYTVSRRLLEAEERGTLTEGLRETGLWVDIGLGGIFSDS
jgi:hypothetical protein